MCHDKFSFASTRRTTGHNFFYIIPSNNLIQLLSNSFSCADSSNNPWPCHDQFSFTLTRKTITFQFKHIIFNIGPSNILILLQWLNFTSNNLILLQWHNSFYINPSITLVQLHYKISVTSTRQITSFYVKWHNFFCINPSHNLPQFQWHNF